ncbi:penicillin-binding protein [Streptomyces sp. NBC_01142]|uniref:transglycosylase domain-containing protein n=1 Tax=Streptomyces sp. NBC_01142 TaxID=2975865 RepID=UPI002252B7B9|nr:transglycosylase domain-containing protein [Streptomyces sp. NBC_01142]MCX4821149.1 penicillin-binding protein [Streptomyces sp. NBC_01142]
MRTWWSPDRTTERQKASWISAVGTPREAREAEDEDRSKKPDRKMHRERRRRTGLRRFFTWRKALVGVVCLFVLLVGGFTVLYLVIDIPRANALAKAQSNVYVYSDGTRIARTGEINRETVPLSKVPEGVRHAFVAAENKDFYSDSGVSLTGTARGIVNTVTGQGKQGGSTITQQYVKNYYLSQEQTVSRKVKELVISLKVDRHNTKDDILAGYLNSSYYGRQAYGIQAAARAYYDKDVEDLTVEEGAYLAALLQAPSQYDWTVASPAGKRLVQERWGYVLDNMVDVGWLDKGQRQPMRFPEPVEPKPAAGLGGQAGYLVDAARRELTASGISEQELAGGGWRITLNIEPDKQQALERAIGLGLGAEDSNQQAGAVSVDPRNGSIVALYGGRDYFKHYLNNATRSDYQAGPTFEPVVLAATLEAQRENNFDVGLKQIRETAADLGMDPTASGFNAPRATSLGLMGTSPLEMVGVHATLNNEGKKVTPSIVKSAQRDDFRTQLQGAVGGQVIDPGTADIVTKSLSDAVDPRTGGFSTAGPVAVGRNGRIAARATGPSDDRKAHWFVGGTPELVTSIGFFGEDTKTRKQVALDNIGDGFAARIWNMYTQEVLQDESSASSPAPTPPPPPTESSDGEGTGDEVAGSSEVP